MSNVYFTPDSLNKQVNLIPSALNMFKKNVKRSLVILESKRWSQHIIRKHISIRIRLYNIMYAAIEIHKNVARFVMQDHLAFSWVDNVLYCVMLVKLLNDLAHQIDDTIYDFDVVSNSCHRPLIYAT